MKNEILCFAIGAKCPIRLQEGEGAALKFSQAGLCMFVSISSPDKYERKAFKSGHPTKFAVAKFGRMGLLAADFGEGFSFDMPFDVGIEDDADIPNLVLSSPESRVTLKLVAVDSKTKLVFGIRLVTLSPAVSAEISNIVSEQRSGKISTFDYNTNLCSAYSAFPSTDKLMDSASASCKV